MKFKRLLTAGLFIIGCSDNNSISQKPEITPSTGVDGVQEEVASELHSYEYEIGIDNQKILFSELTRTEGDLDPKIESWFRIQISDEGEFSETIFQVDKNGKIVGRSSENSQMKEQFSSMQEEASESVQMKGPHVSKTEIKEILRIKSFFSLYRCRNTDLGTTLAQQDLMFSGDWHFGVRGPSKYLEETSLQIVLVFSRDTGRFKDIAFYKRSGYSKSFQIDPNPSLSLYLNIPENEYIGDSDAPASGQYEIYRSACDEFYDRYFKKNNESEDSKKQTVRDYQKRFLPVFDEKFEKSLYTPELPDMQLPAPIVNPFSIESNKMKRSTSIEVESLGDAFFNRDRFPLSTYDYESDPLWDEFYKKGENQ